MRHAPENTGIPRSADHSEAVRADLDLPREMTRKLVHLALAIIPTCYAWVHAEWTLMCTAVATLACMAIDLGRRSSAWLQRWIERRFAGWMRRHEQRGWTGFSTLLLGMLLAMILFPPRVAWVAMMMACVSDAAGAMVGRWAQSRREPALARAPSKSLAGCCAVFASAAGIALVQFPSQPWAAVSAALAAAAAEAASVRIGPWRLDDNLAIPLLAGSVLWFAAG